jgi:hypothetical protein
MPIVIEEFVVDTPPPETAATDQARGHAGSDAGPAAAWTATFAHRLEAELALATERAARLHAD